MGGRSATGPSSDVGVSQLDHADAAMDWRWEFLSVVSIKFAFNRIGRSVPRSGWHQLSSTYSCRLPSSHSDRSLPANEFGLEKIERRTPASLRAREAGCDVRSTTAASGDRCGCSEGDLGSRGLLAPLNNVLRFARIAPSDRSGPTCLFASASASAINRISES